MGITFDPIQQLSALWVNDQLVGSLKSTVYDLFFKKSFGDEVPRFRRIWTHGT